LTRSRIRSRPEGFVDELEAAIRFWEDADKGQVEEFWQAGLSKHSFVLS
jgi:hypothetical protein